MLSKIAAYMQEQGLVRQDDRVLCMVSGGADSVAMLHLLKQLSPGSHPAFPSSFSLGVCHVNYGRRGHESDEDEIHVRRLADQMGAPMHVIQAPREHRPNFQAWARDFRYLAAQNLCRWQGYTRIAVAHNRDDRIETFLYRLMTYSGRRSLVVMPPVRGRIIRPLLYATAADVRGFCVEAGITYREDASNASLDYTRNRIRHNVIPRMAEIRPDFRERITDTLCLLEDEDAVLETVTAEAWRGIVHTDEDSGETSLDATALAELPRATARLVVRRWLTGATVRLRLSRQLLDSILMLCRHGNGTAGISLPDGVRVERRYDRLLLVSPPQDLPERQEKRSAPGPEEAAGGAAEVTLTVPGKAVFGDYEIEAVESPGWDVTGDDPLQATIDAARLSLPLKIRSWRSGDRFRPLGMGGSKSLQDFFTDEKVPRPERENIPIIVSADKIAWVCGHRLSEEFKVTDFTRRTIGLKATRRAVERAIRDTAARS